MPDPRSSQLSTCNEGIPLLPVTRQFDFGQFVMLYQKEERAANGSLSTPARRIVLDTTGAAPAQTGASSTSRNLVKVEPNRILFPQRSDTVAAVASVVAAFLATGVEGPRTPVDIEVPDVGELIAAGGRVTASNRDSSNHYTHQIILDAETVEALSAGFTITVKSDACSGQEPTLLRLTPRLASVNLAADAVPKIIAGSEIALDRAGRIADLGPDQIRGLLAGQRVVARARRRPSALAGAAFARAA